MERRMEGGRKRKGEGREGWKEGKRKKKGRVDFLLASWVSFPGVALNYISEGKRVFIRVALC